VDIEFAIVRGERVFVERIDIEGNATTLDQVVRRQFRTVEGDPFNPREIRQSAERIRALGFFSDAQVECRTGRQPGSGGGERRRRGTADRVAEPGHVLFGGESARLQHRLLRVELPWPRPEPVDRPELGHRTRTPASALPNRRCWAATSASASADSTGPRNQDYSVYDTRNIGF
jgi:hypothetical protein